MAPHDPRAASQWRRLLASFPGAGPGDRWAEGELDGQAFWAAPRVWGLAGGQAASGREEGNGGTMTRRVAGS